MNLKNMSNNELVLIFETSVTTERKITAEVIKYIAEIDRRRLFIEKGFTSLFDYLVKSIGYSPGSAMRRIDAARLLQEMPEVIDQFEKGEVTLSQATQVQRASRDQKRIKNRQLTVADKRDLIAQIANLNQKETEKIIANTLDFPAPKQEKEVLHKDCSVTLTLTLTREQMEILEKAQDTIAHSGASTNWADTITYLAKKELARRTHTSPPKTRRASGISNAAAAVGDSPTSTPQSRYISQHVRKKILHADAMCTYKNPNGELCNSRRFLQVDHVHSWSHGGTNNLDNLQVLCGVHNRYKYHLEQVVERYPRKRNR